MSNPKRQYVGAKEVAKVEDTAQEHIALVRYVDGSWEEVHRDVLDKLFSKDPYDLSELRLRRTVFMAGKILETLTKYNSYQNEVEHTFQRVIASLQENVKAAEGRAWRRDGEERRNIGEITLLDIDRLMKA